MLIKSKGGTAQFLPDVSKKEVTQIRDTVPITSSLIRFGFHSNYDERESYTLKKLVQVDTQGMHNAADFKGQEHVKAQIYLI